MSPDELSSAAYWVEQFDQCYLDTNVDGKRHAAVVKRLQEVLDRLKLVTEHSAEWQAGFDTARYQAACEMGHFIDDEDGGIGLAEAAYDRLATMIWNPRCRAPEEPG